MIRDGDGNAGVMLPPGLHDSETFDRAKLSVLNAVGKRGCCRLVGGGLGHHAGVGESRGSPEDSRNA